MKKVRWVPAAAGTALVAAAFALPGAGVAYAAGPDGNVLGNGNLGIVSGNTVTAPVSVPINLCGVSVALLGGASSGCTGGASTSTDVSGSDGTTGNGNTTGDDNLGIGSGNTVTAPVSVPVNICGVSAAVAGFANGGCAGGAQASTTTGSSTDTGNGNVTGNGDPSVLSGNTITAPVSAPVNVCGVSLGLLGFSNSGCAGGATTAATDLPGDSNGNTMGNDDPSILSGNTITAPVSVPVNVCGVSLAVLGFSSAACQGAAAVNPPPSCGCTGTTAASTTATGTTAAGTTATGTTAASTPASATSLSNTPLGNTTAVTTSALVSTLPANGANLLALLVGGLGALGVGAGTVVLARRRSSGEAS